MRKWLENLLGFKFLEEENERLRERISDLEKQNLELIKGREDFFLQTIDKLRQVTPNQVVENELTPELDLSTISLNRHSARDLITQKKLEYDTELITTQEELQEQLLANSGLKLNKQKSDELVEKARALRASGK